MNLTERNLRVTGYAVFTSIFFVFFMLEMFFSWQDENLLAKVLLITIVHTLLIWEPTRFFILSLRKKMPGLINARKRLQVATLVLVPYAFLLGFLRIFFEDYSNLWGIPVAAFSTYSYTIGISLLFILLQLAVYESFYFFNEWNKTREEAEDLKRLNMLIQMDSLKVQIQPHFLFNTLNTLIGLIEADQKRAVHFTENLAFVYRYLLEASEKMFIPLEEEMDFSRRYFSLLKTRYPAGLHLTENIEAAASEMVPPLTLQILIENAVKHNKISTAKPLYIDVDYDAVTERVVVSNNLQPKTGGAPSGKGLVHLKKKFSLLRLPELQIEQSEKDFVVRFPLIKANCHESIDH